MWSKLVSVCGRAALIATAIACISRAIARPAMRRGGSAILSPTGSKSAINHLILHCKIMRDGHHLPPNVAASFIDHSSEMWNFRCDGLLYCRPLLNEKGESHEENIGGTRRRRHLGSFGRSRARPRTTRFWRRSGGRRDRRRHRRRRARRPPLLWPRLWLLRPRV